MTEREHIVVVGATSGIAQALVPILAARGGRLVLAGRDMQRLEAIATGAREKSQTTIVCETYDALPGPGLEAMGPEAFVARCLAHLEGRIDGVILCHGYLPPAEPNPPSDEVLRATIEVNYTSPVLLLEAFARPLVERRGGYLAAITSVAGDRGRQSNYPYGAAKGALTLYLQGLRNRLFPLGVHVLTIKPGFVDTPMIAGRVNPRSPLVARPERVARDIDRAIRRRRNVIYTPWFWRPIMRVLCLLPEAIFKRLKL